MVFLIPVRVGFIGFLILVAALALIVHFVAYGQWNDALKAVALFAVLFVPSYLLWRLQRRFQ